MTPDRVRWRKSSRSSGQNGNCVELAHTRKEIRDSKNPDGPTLRVPVGAMLEALRPEL